MTGLHRTQYEFLTRGIDPKRVQNLRGQSHLEAWDVRRHLIRVFGFDGFDIETKDLTLVSERQLTHDSSGNPIPPHKPRWTVVYRAEVRLSIKVDGQVIAVFEDGATGDSSNQPSLGDAHDQAMKTALSQGLKRCAVNLGDQFGLSLYNDGRADAVVLRSLVAPEGDEPSSAPLPADDAPVLPEPAPSAVDEHPPAEPVETAPEPVDRPGVRMVEQAQHRKMHVLWRELGFDGEANREKRLEITAKVLGLPSIESSAHLTFDQAEKVIAAQQAKKRHAERRAAQTTGATA